jgi:hypothetical protein
MARLRGIVVSGIGSCALGSASCTITISVTLGQSIINALLWVLARQRRLNRRSFAICSSGSDSELSRPPDYGIDNDLVPIRTAIRSKQGRHNRCLSAVFLLRQPKQNR